MSKTFLLELIPNDKDCSCFLFIIRLADGTCMGGEIGMAEV